MYRDAWTESFASTFPNRGVHFLSVDAFSRLPASSTVSESFALIHTELAADLSPHAEVTLVARGPLPCLVAQYYLESLPLSGLILVDPLIVPRRVSESNTGDAGNTDEIGLQSSAQSFMLTTSQANCFDFETCDDHSRGEIMLLDKMQQQNDYDRPLKLEAGVVPVKVLYSGGDIAHEGEFRRCAEVTASYHTPNDFGDKYVWGDVAVEKIERGVDSVVETIYSFHDEII